MSRFSFVLAFLSLCLSGMGFTQQLTETAKIETLISHIESLNDATFIRNGSEYSSKNAAKFLRGKWDANKKENHTANDFIDKAATKSSTTAKSYQIRLKGAAEKPCADYLKLQLAMIEAAAGR
jgi:hypothetical protein